MRRRSSRRARARSRRRRGGGGRSRGSRGSRPGRDLAEWYAHREGLARGDGDRRDASGGRCRHLQVDLVGQHLDDDLIDGDGVADRDAPLDHHALGDRLHVRQHDRDHRSVAGRLDGLGGAGNGAAVPGPVPGDVSSGHLREQSAHLDGLARRRHDARDAARSGGRDLDVHLVGGDVEKRLARLDRIAFGDPPFDHDALGDRLAELGQHYLDGLGGGGQHAEFLGYRDRHSDGGVFVARAHIRRQAAFS